MNLNTSESSSALQPSSSVNVNQARQKGEKSENSKPGNVELKLGLNDAGKGGLVGRVGAENAEPSESTACEKIENHLKTFAKQASTVPKDRKKILLMRL